MKNLIFAIFSTIILIFFSSCSSLFNNSEESFIVYDTIRVEIDEYNNLRRAAVAGYPHIEQAVLSELGDEVTFQQGDQLELISNGIDFGLYSLDIVTDEEANEITIRVVDKQDSKVILSRMCQTIERMNTDKIPEVELAPDLPPQQVVITPIVDDECYVIGYQIRYGTLERGCRRNDRAKEVYDSFNDCYPKKSNIKRHTRTLPNEKDYFEWMLPK
jgi:hypothetical protein